MQFLRGLIASLVATSTATLPVFAGPGIDLWVHPRNESYDPARHYLAPDGELYYKAENDIEDALGRIALHGGVRPMLSVELGADLRRVAEETGGALTPVLLYDGDGDRRVDRTISGRLEDERAVFDSEELAELELRQVYWQLGIRYSAGEAGDRTLDGRYLASVDSGEALVAWERIEELPRVAAPPPLPEGLVVLKHREGAAFDFAAFTENPAGYTEDFDLLTREADQDDWETEGGEGRLVTHFSREDLFLVRVTEGLRLVLEWGDLPLLDYLQSFLRIEPDTDGCYSTLRSGLLHRDGSPVAVPHRVFYCPEDSVALFDAPDGYEIGLFALRDGTLVEHTEAATSTRDNLRLYASEIYQRNPSRRATGTIVGNLRAGFVDAGRDLADALRHALTGSIERDIHSGQEGYRPSLVTAVPLTLWELARVKPRAALDTLLTGAGSAVQSGADAVSAVSNGVLNPVLQLGVGAAISPRAADRSGDAIGTVAQALVQNLPLGERSTDALSPVAALHHDRAFARPRYTRTDTQLNLDRVMSALDVYAIRAIHRHNRSGDSAQATPEEVQEAPAPPAAPVPRPGCS